MDIQRSWKRFLTLKKKYPDRKWSQFVVLTMCWALYNTANKPSLPSQCSAVNISTKFNICTTLYKPLWIMKDWLSLFCCCYFSVTHTAKIDAIFVGCQRNYLRLIRLWLFIIHVYYHLTKTSEPIVWLIIHYFLTSIGGGVTLFLVWQTFIYIS